MLRSSVCLGLLVCGCASAHSEVLEPPEERPQLWDAAVAEVPDEPATKCPIEIPTAPKAAAAPSDPTGDRCGKPSRALARQLRQDARDRWYFPHEADNLDVDFECDRFAPKIRELVIETSDGHGFSLHLDRIRPRSDGDYDLLRLAYGSTGNHVAGADEWANMQSVGGIVQTVVLPRARFDSALRAMRAALHLRFQERLSGNNFGGSMSSRDFHVAIRLTDADGHGLDRFWAGYESSEDQATWVPLDLAAEAYAKVVWADDIQASLETHSPTDGDRDFFLDRFVAARDRNAEYGYWYVRERLIAMARDLADVRLAADLVEIARKNGEHSEARSQAAAVDVLVRLTGYDPRYDADTPRPPAEAAADMIRVCG